MPGSNARVRTVTNTAFTPSGSTATARISVRSATNGAFGSVKNAYLNPSTNIWVGAPPIPTAPTYRNVRTGTFPNLNNSIWVDWTSDTSGIIASFDVFVKIGAGAYSLAANVSAATRTYNYGAIAANTTYSFYVRTNGVSGLTTTSPESSTSLAGAGLVSVLGTAETADTATASWTVTAGVFQKYFVYDNATLIATVNGTELGTSFSYQRTGLTPGTTYNFRVYAQNLDGFTGSYREANIMPFTVPGKVATPTLTAATGTATIDRFTWVAPSPNGRAITQYGLQVKQNTDAFGTEAIHTNLASLIKDIETAYTVNRFSIRVRAYNSAGVGSYSDESAQTAAWAPNAGTSTLYDPNCGPAGCSDTITETQSTGMPECAGICDDGRYCNCGAQYRYRTRSRTIPRTRTSSGYKTAPTNFYSRTGNDNTTTTVGVYGEYGNYTYGEWVNGTPTAWVNGEWGEWSACDSTGTWGTVDPCTSGTLYNWLGDGVNWEPYCTFTGANGFNPSNNQLCNSGTGLNMWTLQICNFTTARRAIDQNYCYVPEGYM